LVDQALQHRVAQCALGLQVNELTLISGFMNWALLARFSDGNAGFSINIVANFLAHSALAYDGGLRIAGPANSSSPPRTLADVGLCGWPRQRIEIRDAILVLDDQLAIDQRSFAGEFGSGLDYPAIWSCPVPAMAGEGSHPCPGR
jgi:hypothetical protein